MIGENACRLIFFTALTVELNYVVIMLFGSMLKWLMKFVFFIRCIFSVPFCLLPRAVRVCRNHPLATDRLQFIIRLFHIEILVEFLVDKQI